METTLSNCEVVFDLSHRFFKLYDFWNLFIFLLLKSRFVFLMAYVLIPFWKRLVIGWNHEHLLPFEQLDFHALFMIFILQLAFSYHLLHCTRFRNCYVCRHCWCCLQRSYCLIWLIWTLTDYVCCPCSLLFGWPSCCSLICCCFAFNLGYLLNLRLLSFCCLRGSSACQL